MRKRRSNLEIQKEILEFSVENIKPTHLMYATRLSWGSLHDNVDSLKARGLIEEIELEGRIARNDKRTKINYRTTDKGTHILKTLKEVTKSIG